MEVIGYTSGGSTVVGVPDLNKIERRGVTVMAMPHVRTKRGTPRLVLTGSCFGMN